MCCCCCVAAAILGVLLILICCGLVLLLGWNLPATFSTLSIQLGPVMLPLSCVVFCCSISCCATLACTDTGRRLGWKREHQGGMGRLREPWAGRPGSPGLCAAKTRRVWPGSLPPVIQDLLANIARD